MNIGKLEYEREVRRASLTRNTRVIYFSRLFI